MEVFIAKDQQFVADWIVCQGLGKLVEVFSILCISSLLIKAQLSLNIARSIGNDQRESTYAFFLRIHDELPAAQNLLRKLAEGTLNVPSANLHK